MKTLVRLFVITAVLAGFAFAQNAALAPLGITFLNSDGTPLSGGLIYSYAAGGSSPIQTFTSSSGATANSNPVVLDAGGNGTIFLLPGTGYRFVIQNSNGITIRTLDGIVVSLPNTGGAWNTSGSNISNTNSGNVGIGCATPISKLDVCGTSSGNNYLTRIEDAASSPGINLIGASSALLGSIAADSTAAFRVRAANNASQLVVTQGGVTVQNQTAGGPTTLTVEAGSSQGTTHLLSVQDSAATELSYFDQLGRLVAPLYNATATGSAFGFQLSNSNFLVDGNGNISFSGSLFGAEGSSFPLIDTSQNAIVNNLTVRGTCTGCGGGGGGGSFPVPDTTNLIESNADHTKLFKINASTNIPTSTTITMTVPAANFTPVSEENAETIVGLKTFTADHVTGNYWNAANSGTSLVFNSVNIQMDGNGNITANASGATPGVTGGNINAFGFVDTAIWYGMKPSSSTPSVTPGGGYSALTYKGGTSGLHIWLYDTVHSTWSDIDLGSVAGGLTSINGQTGPAVTIAGTTGEVIVANTTNTVTLSTPQPIATTSNVTFANVTTGTGGAFNSQAGTGQTGYTISNGFGSPFIVDGDGNISGRGSVNVTASTGLGAYRVNGTVVIDASRNATVQNLIINGTCTGCASGSVSSITGTANQVLASAAIGAVTLSLPQSIATSNTPTFAGVITPGTFNSSNSGGGSAFQTNTGTFIVTGSGNISGQLVNSNAYQISGVTVIDSSKNATVANLTVTGSCTGCGGGGGAVSSIIGTSNEIIASSPTGTVTLSTPQPIGILSNTAFNSINVGCGAAGTSQYVVQSCAPAGGSYAFVISNFNFLVNGNGDISSNGSINATGADGLAPYRVGGTAIVDTSRNATFNNLTVNGSSCSGVFCLANGGSYTAQSNLTMGGSSNFYLRTFSGTPSCSGVPDGWAGIDVGGSNLWVCIGGVAKKAALI